MTKLRIKIKTSVVNVNKITLTSKIGNITCTITACMLNKWKCRDNKPFIA